MDTGGPALRKLQDPQGEKSQNPAFPKKGLLGEGNEKAATPRRVHILGKCALMATLFFSAAAGSACNRDTFGKGVVDGWDGGPADTETDSRTGTEADADTDMDTDSDTGPDTETNTEDTETFTETGTGKCPDTDTSNKEYDDLEFRAENGAERLWITATSDGRGCSFSSEARLKITASEGELEIPGIVPFVNFEPPTRIAKTIYLLGANDPGTSEGDCKNSGLDTASAILVLSPAPTVNYAFPLSRTQKGYQEIIYRLGKAEMGIGIYDKNGRYSYPTPTGLDEIHAVFPAGLYSGKPIVDSLGIAILREGGASLLAASSQKEPENALYRITPQVQGWDVLSRPLSGISMCGFIDGASLVQLSQIYSGAVLFEGSPDHRHIKVPKQ